MRAIGGISMAVVMVVVILTVTSPQPAEAQWEGVIAAVVSKLLKLWDSGDLEFAGHACHYRYRPTIRGFQLRYKGKFWCDGVPLSGRSLTKSRSGAVEHATRDFVTQALQKGYITEEEASEWVNN